MLSKRAIEELPLDRCTPGFYSRIFLVLKKNGKWRPVIDLSAFNKFVVSPHFKMLQPREVLARVLPGHWATSIDLKDAYFHIPILKSARKFLRFTFGGRVYQFRVLPFGVTTAPLVFTKLLQVVSAYLHSRGVDILIYFDDSLVLHFERDKLVRNTQLVLSLLVRLGFIPSEEKSEINPSQDFIFLGYRFRTDLGVVLPPQEKFLRARDLSIEFSRSRQVSARRYLRFLGYLNSIADVVPLGRLHIRPIQAYLLQAWSPASQDWDCPVILDATVRQAALWWSLENNVLKGSPLETPPPKRTLYTDASLTGWGAFLEGRTLSGTWNRKETSFHINMLEMMAVRNALEGLLPQLRKTSVSLAVDNSTVVAYINNQGGTKSQDLCLLTREILLFCQKNQICLQVRHIPGKLNVLADTLSRSIKPVITEWTLSQEIFNFLTQVWDRPHIDLFATSLNNRLPTFVSPVPEEKALATDAFSLNWDGMHTYAFPPFNLVGRVVHKLQSHSCLMILIAPLWPAQPWFPELLNCLIDYPRELPLVENLLTQPVTRAPHTRPGILHLHAWRLSSQVSLQRAFRRRLPIASLDQLGIPQLPSTKVDGRFSAIGVSAGRLILSLPLYRQ